LKNKEKPAGVVTNYGIEVNNIEDV